MVSYGLVVSVVSTEVKRKAGRNRRKLRLVLVVVFFVTIISAVTVSPLILVATVAANRIAKGVKGEESDSRTSQCVFVQDPDLLWTFATPDDNDVYSALILELVGYVDVGLAILLDDADEEDELTVEESSIAVFFVSVIAFDDDFDFGSGNGVAREDETGEDAVIFGKITMIALRAGADVKPFFESGVGLVDSEGRFESGVPGVSSENRASDPGCVSLVDGKNRSNRSCVFLCIHVRSKVKGTQKTYVVVLILVDIQMLDTANEGTPDNSFNDFACLREFPR